MQASFGSTRRRLLAGLIGAAGAVVVVGYVLFFLNQTTAPTPTSAVATLLKSAETGDVASAKSVLCRADVALGPATRLAAIGHVVAFTVGAKSVHGGAVSVQAAVVTTAAPAPRSEVFPVVREGAFWKVCFSR